MVRGYPGLTNKELAAIKACTKLMKLDWQSLAARVDCYQTRQIRERTARGETPEQIVSNWVFD